MQIAIAVFDGVEELDFAGPYEVLSYWAQIVATDPVHVFLLGPSMAPVTGAMGMQVLPHRSWLDVAHDHQQVDVLLVPGGVGARTQMSDPDVIDRINALAAGGTLMTSVCTGALVYASAGLLRDRAATTHHRAFDELLAADPSIDARRTERFVDSGEVITAAGVSAGIDMALHLVARLDSTTAARAVRDGIEYHPEPPV